MKRTALLLALLLAAMAPVRAYAYLDPASGSMLLQLIVGGVAGLGLLLKLFWHRILGFFRRKGGHDGAAD